MGSAGGKPKQAKRTPKKPARKPAVRAKKTPAVRHWGFLLWGGAALAVLILLFLWSRVPDSSYQPSTAFMNGKIPAGAGIPYEEPLPPAALHSDLDLGEIDEALFRGLRQAGVPPQATHLALAHGPAGEISVLRVQLPAGVAPSMAAAKLDSQLAGGKAKASWRSLANGRELSVTLGKRLTHRVILESLATAKPLPPAPQPAAPAMPPPRPPLSPKAEGTRLALIIDDIGYQLGAAKELINLGLPLTLSILPHSPHGREIALLARKRGLEVLLHLPMEPKGYPGVKPGPGALLTSMTPEELVKVTQDDLASVPGAKGANNHMGSSFTENEKALRPVLQVLADRGLFFIDSVTSPKSRAYYLACGLGMNAARRTIFLDHDHRLPAVRRQVQRMLSLAQSGSLVVAIGHPHAETIKALAEVAPLLKRQVNMVAASQIISGPSLAQGKPPSPPEIGDELDSPPAKP